MNLEVGMYVRTKAGMIAKIVSKEDVSGSLHREEIVFILDNGNKLALHSQKVIKASHNIIDLIEVGDFVNGLPVVEIYEKGNKFKYSSLYSFSQKTIEVANDNYETIPNEALYTNEDIKSIVTKEQFESMAYKVVE